MPEYNNPSDSDSDANFLGWQKNLPGEFFPLFNITVSVHPSYHSTVMMLVSIGGCWPWWDEGGRGGGHDRGGDNNPGRGHDKH